MPKAGLSTMADVARHAGVGVATVDRVMNQRARVRADTAQRVLVAAEQIGFRGAGLIKRRVSESGQQRRLGFLLQKRGSIFFQLMAQALADAGRAAPQVGEAVIEFMDDLTPRLVVEQLRRMADRVDALALVATEHPVICAAVDALGAEGMPVFPLISDLSSGAAGAYVGLDNRMAGRTAGWAIARLNARPGKVAIMLGTHRYLCQEDNEVSFRAYFAEQYPDFRVLDTAVTLENRDLAEEATREMLHQHPDLVGFYLAGGGIEGVMEALRQHPAARAIVTVCHELTPLTSAGLRDGYLDLVISHGRDAMAGQLIDAMLAAAAVGERGQDGKRQLIMPMELYTPENV